METPSTPTPADKGTAQPLTNFKDVQAKSLQWLWPGFIPLAKLAMLDGDPGLGKSTLLLDLAARVSRGGEMPDGTQGVSGNVIILSAEDDPEDTIKPRLESAQAQLERIYLLAAVGEQNGARPVQIPRDLSRLDDLVREHDARLLILDPMMAFLAGVDANRDQDIRRVLFELANIATRRQCAVICVRHLNKGDSAKAIYRGASSIALIGHARTGLLVAQDPDDDTHRVLAVAKCNIAAKPPALRFVLEQQGPTARIAWRGPCPYQADRLVARPPTEERRQSLKQTRDAELRCQEFLLDMLKWGATPVKDAKQDCTDAGFSLRTIERAIHNLGVVLKRSYGVNKWSLPGGK